MAMPARLAEIVEEFADLPAELRLEALLDYSRRVPPLPERLAGHRDAMEQVPECQTPFFLATELGDGDRVTIHFDAPPEAPTTRGFAGILSEGLNGATAAEVLAVPNGFYTALGLDRVISPLRLRGISAILGRLKRQVGVQVEARAAGPAGGLVLSRQAPGLGGHEHAVERVARGVVDDDVAEAGVGEHGPGQLLAPGRAEAGAAAGQRHGQAVQRAHRVQQRRQRVGQVAGQVAGGPGLDHDEGPAGGQGGVDPRQDRGRVHLVVDGVEHEHDVEGLLDGQAGGVADLEPGVGQPGRGRLGPGPGDGVGGQVVADEGRGRVGGGQEHHRVPGAAADVGHPGAGGQPRRPARGPAAGTPRPAARRRCRARGRPSRR